MARHSDENSTPNRRARTRRRIPVASDNGFMSSPVQQGVEAAAQIREVARLGVQELSDTAADYVLQGREQLALLRHNFQQRVADRPFRALLIAGAVGLVAGRWLRRR